MPDILMSYMRFDNGLDVNGDKFIEVKSIRELTEGFWVGRPTGAGEETQEVGGEVVEALFLFSYLL